MRPAPRSTLFPYTTLFRSPGNESEIEMAWELEAGSYSGEWVVSNEDRSVQFDLSSGSHATLTLVERSNRSEEHTSELQSRGHLVCRLLLEKKKNNTQKTLE